MQQNEKNEASEVLQLISKDFNRPGLESVISVKDLYSFNELKEYLIEKITDLLDNNFDRLVNTLYMIDIDEEKLKILFAGKSHKHIPSRLADLIIERQLQKLHFRQKYKSKKN